MHRLATIHSVNTQYDDDRRQTDATLQHKRGRSAKQQSISPNPRRQLCEDKTFYGEKDSCTNMKV